MRVRLIDRVLGGLRRMNNGVPIFDRNNGGRRLPPTPASSPTEPTP